MNYIVPKITKYSNIDELLKNESKTPSLFDIENFLSIDDLLSENFVCIVGEPGVGKSRLISEIKTRLTEKPLSFCNASEFKPQVIPSDVEYCIVDALDEVDGSEFNYTLQLIKQYKEEHQDVKVMFSCRKHYVVSYASFFSSCTKLVFVEVNRLDDQEVTNIIDTCADVTKENINRSPKLRKLLSIPRYLMFLLESENQREGISNIGELFEFIVDRSIDEALKEHDKPVRKENFKALIKRIIEKIAFIMEISRKDKISKDDLYTIIDELKGNMAHMLVANFDLLFFESRILKETNGILQFGNSEIQEYLAAKELGRQDNIESVLYDVAVQKELKHIYPNWYDVIPHLSYSEGRSDSFVNVFKLITAYESHLENDTFESLLRYVNPSTLGVHQRADLFSNLFDHYQRVPAYIKWRGPIQNLIQECYTSSCNLLGIFSDLLNKIQLTNIYTILEGLVENNKLDESVVIYWKDAATTLMETEDSEKQQIALNFYYALKDDENLRNLASTFESFTEEVKQKYIEVTGYRKITDRSVINCWLTDCYKGSPEAINAVLCIDDPESIIYAYNEILSEEGRDFFNPKGSSLVPYELYLPKQFNIVWERDQDSKILMTQVIAYFVKNRTYSSLKEINTVVKQILLEEETGIIFFNY